MEGFRDIAGALEGFGYKGDCLDPENLWYAVRVGACSWQYLDLIAWLEGKVMFHAIGDEFVAIFRELRSSYLKITPPLCDPFDFRLRMLKYLSQVIKKSSLKGFSKILEDQRSDLGVEKTCNDILNESVLGEQKVLYNVKLCGSDIDKLETFDHRRNEVMIPCSSTDQRNSEAAIWLSIVNDYSPTGEITKGIWVKLQKSLKSILTILINGFRNSNQLNSLVDIKFNVTKYNDQIRMVLCSNLYSAELLHRAIEQLMEDERVVIFNLDQLSREFVITAWTWIPKTYMDPTIILDLIALHNNSLCTDDWDILKQGPTAGSGQHYLLKLCRSALPVLKTTGGYLSFGNARIYLRLNKELRNWFDFNTLEMGDYIKS